jgi:hypothetical protein
VARCNARVGRSRVRPAGCFDRPTPSARSLGARLRGHDGETACAGMTSFDRHARSPYYHAAMHKPGTDPHNVQMSDVLCDFCHREWTEGLPVVEGHHGSIVCGVCLTAAWATVVNEGVGTAKPGYQCTMCLERREEAGWESPAYPEASVCRRCIRMAGVALERDEDLAWRRPG